MDLLGNYLRLLRLQVDEFLGPFVEIAKMADEYTSDWLDEIDWEREHPT